MVLPNTQTATLESNAPHLDGSSSEGSRIDPTEQSLANNLFASVLSTADQNVQIGSETPQHENFTDITGYDPAGETIADMTGYDSTGETMANPAELLGQNHSTETRTEPNIAALPQAEVYSSLAKLDQQSIAAARAYIADILAHKTAIQKQLDQIAANGSTPPPEIEKEISIMPAETAVGTGQENYFSNLLLTAKMMAELTKSPDDAKNWRLALKQRYGSITEQIHKENQKADAKHGRSGA